MRHLNYLWRMIAKFWALAFIFVGGGLLAIFLLPLVTLGNKERCERAQLLIHFSFRFYLWTLQRLGVIELHIEGGDLLKQEGQIVIANHPSLLDVVILMSLIPRVQCIVKHQLWNHKTLGILMRRAEYIRNDLPPEQIIEQCKMALHKGRTLIIFPEGTRTALGASPHFSRGFANIALLTNTLVRPVYISCSPPHLFKGEPWWQVPTKKPTFRVKVEEPLDTKNYLIYGPPSLAARKFAHAVEQQYACMTDYGPPRN